MACSAADYEHDQALTPRILSSSRAAIIRRSKLLYSNLNRRRVLNVIPSKLSKVTTSAADDELFTQLKTHINSKVLHAVGMCRRVPNNTVHDRLPKLTCAALTMFLDDGNKNLSPEARHSLCEFYARFAAFVCYFQYESFAHHYAKHCSIEKLGSSKKQSKSPEKEERMLTLLDMAHAHRDVSAFVWSVVRDAPHFQYIYGAAFGTAGGDITTGTNCRLIQKWISTYVCMGVGDSISYGDIVRDIDMRRFQWLRHRYICRVRVAEELYECAKAQQHNKEINDIRNQQQQHLMPMHASVVAHYVYAVLLQILLERLVQGLLRVYFYVTEAQSLRYQLLYYRREVWQAIETRALQDLTHDGRWKIIDNFGLFQQKYAGVNRLSVGRARFLPKVNKVRPILTFVSDSRCRNQISPSSSLAHPMWNFLNQQSWRQACVFFDSLVRHIMPHALGLGLHRHHEAVDKWIHWCRSLPLHHDNKNNKKLYYIRTDFRDCFGRINRARLRLILEQHRLLDAEFICNSIQEYYYLVSLTPNSTKQQKEIVLEHKMNWQKRLEKQAKRRQNSDVNTGADDEYVVVEFGAKRDKAMELAIVLVNTLQLFCMQNDNDESQWVFRHKEKYYELRDGIPQGLNLSELLCNLYIADVEREIYGSSTLAEQQQQHLQNITTKELFLRYADDILYVTYDAERGRQVLDAITTAFADVPVEKLSTSPVPPHNMVLSGSKFKTNVLETPTTTSDSELVQSWCGFYLNLASPYGIRVDFRKRTHGTSSARYWSVYYGLDETHNDKMFVDNNSASALPLSFVAAATKPRNKFCGRKLTLSSTGISQPRLLYRLRQTTIVKFPPLLFHQSVAAQDDMTAVIYETFVWIAFRVAVYMLLKFGGNGSQQLRRQPASANTVREFVNGFIVAQLVPVLTSDLLNKLVAQTSFTQNDAARRRILLDRSKRSNVTVSGRKRTRRRYFLSRAEIELLAFVAFHAVFSKFSSQLGSLPHQILAALVDKQWQGTRRHYNEALNAQRQICVPCDYAERLKKLDRVLFAPLKQRNGFCLPDDFALCKLL